MNAEIEESEGEEAWDPDVEEELYVQLAGSKSEEEVDDKEMCRPALFPSGRGGRKGRKGGDGGGMAGGWMVRDGVVFGIGGRIVVAHLCIHAN